MPHNRFNDPRAREMLAELVIAAAEQVAAMIASRASAYGERRPDAVTGISAAVLATAAQILDGIDVRASERDAGPPLIANGVTGKLANAVTAWMKRTPKEGG
jgi:hypothetical protein